MARSSIGARELALLHHFDQRERATVGEVAAEFGESNGLARSTVLTMMERLRAKGYLQRHRINGVYRYSAVAAPGDVTRNAVGRFVQKTLGGSVSPFVAWMAERGEVSDAELAELQALVRQLRVERKGK